MLAYRLSATLKVTARSMFAKRCYWTDAMSISNMKAKWRPMWRSIAMPCNAIRFAASPNRPMFWSYRPSLGLHLSKMLEELGQATLIGPIYRSGAAGADCPYRCRHGSAEYGGDCRLWFVVTSPASRMAAPCKAVAISLSVKTSRPAKSASERATAKCD